MNVNSQQPAADGSHIDAKTLQALRESLRLRLDANGHFWQQDDEVTHPGIHTLFLRSISAREGRLVVAVGSTYAFLTCDDAPLRVLHASVQGDAAQVRVQLDDQRELVVALHDFAVDDNDHLLVQVPSFDQHATLWARIRNSALAELAPWLAESGAVMWSLPNGTRHSIATTHAAVNQPVASDTSAASAALNQRS